MGLPDEFVVSCPIDKSLDPDGEKCSMNWGSRGIVGLCLIGDLQDDGSLDPDEDKFAVNWRIREVVGLCFTGDSQNDRSLDPDGDKFPVECGICEIMIGRLEGAFSSFLKISAIEKLVVDILLLFRFNWKLMNCCCYQEACLEKTKIYFLSKLYLINNQKRR